MTFHIHIEKRELLWDDYLIDSEQTTAQLVLHKPVPQEVVLVHDDPWEGDCCIYHNIVEDEGIYRLYYLGVDSPNPDIPGDVPHPNVVCYAESKDGKQWVKPKIRIREFGGSKENNIILDHTDLQLDNFFVFKDTNRDCLKTELYKAVAGPQWSGGQKGEKLLVCYTSADGIQFQYGWLMTNAGTFDTLNTAYWDDHRSEYVCFIRGFHNIPGDDLNKGIRDIRRMVSKDFKHWSIPVLLDFGESDDYPLYTNVIQPYYRAEHMLVGFPTRYVEKEKWTPNFDQLSGADKRKKRMKRDPRYGLAITDCIFMSSRDGLQWKRWDDSFLTPGPEHEHNWVYGDCYPSTGLIETPSDLTPGSNEISMYVNSNHFGRIPTVLRRYTIRKDGFVSYQAKYPISKIVTKPFTFDGSKLSVNFSTSAVGFITIKIIGESKELNSFEIFGDHPERAVYFREGELRDLAGEKVQFEITMRDANLFSFMFSDK